MRPVIEPIVLLQGQLLAIVQSFAKPAELTGGAAAVWAALDMIVKLISRHIAQPHHPLKFDLAERPEGNLVSLFLDTREDQEDDAKPVEQPPQLSRTHDELVSQMAFALGYLDMASDFSGKIRSFLAGTPDPSDVAFAQDAVVVVDEQLDSLRDVLREISSTLTGVESNASLAEHAARLGQLTAYSDGVFLRSSRLQEALKAFAGG